MVRPNWYMVEKKKGDVTDFYFQLAVSCRPAFTLTGVRICFQYFGIEVRFLSIGSLLEKPKITFREPKAETLGGNCCMGDKSLLHFGTKFQH